MILDLTELRQDYKSIYRNNWPLAEKIKILIEVTKIEQRFQSHAHQAAKRIAISTLNFLHLKFFAFFLSCSPNPLKSI